jgi:ribosomal protein S30
MHQYNSIESLVSRIRKIQASMHQNKNIQALMHPNRNVHSLVYQIRTIQASINQGKVTQLPSIRVILGEFFTPKHRFRPYPHLNQVRLQVPKLKIPRRKKNCVPRTVCDERPMYNEKIQCNKKSICSQQSCSLLGQYLQMLGLPKVSNPSTEV